MNRYKSHQKTPRPISESEQADIDFDRSNVTNALGVLNRKEFVEAERVIKMFKATIRSKITDKLNGWFYINCYIENNVVIIRLSKEIPEELDEGRYVSSEEVNINIDIDAVFTFSDHDLVRLCLDKIDSTPKERI